MKAILCLVFVSCFIGGSLGAGCECFTMKPCVCKHANHYVIKAKVTRRGQVDGNAQIYKIEQRAIYKGQDREEYPKNRGFTRVRVVSGCEKQLDLNTNYIFMGNLIDRNTYLKGRFAREGQNNKGMLEMRTNNNWIKLARNLNENQEQWLKDYRDGSEAERQVMCVPFDD